MAFRLKDDTASKATGQANKVKEQKAKERATATEKAKEEKKTTTPDKPKKVEPFKKPKSDYLLLDLVKRKKVTNPATNHLVITKDIEKDYKAYLESVAGRDGITSYIQGLIDRDMKAHERKQAKK